MNTEDTHYFNLLKQAISRTFLAENSSLSSIKDWKGEDITTFQEDLLHKTKASISEKWFYTYIKNEPKKLPRIDMLTILSKYVGFESWSGFKNAQAKLTQKKVTPSKIYYIFSILILIATLFIFLSVKKNTFEFCFVDDDKNETISTTLDIKIIQDSESPIYLKTDSLGCFTYKTKEAILKFIVQSPYYKTDTVIRSIGTNSNTIVKLHTDNYALMLHYYSNGNTKDWKKRKVQLRNLIADNAQIYQVFSQNIGVEIYSKDEFISKLTTPTSNLKKIRILNKSSKNGKIITLKFMIQ